MYVSLFTSACLPVHVYLDQYVYLFLYTTFVHVYLCTYIYIYIYTCSIYMYTDQHMYGPVYLYLYIHICIRLSTLNVNVSFCDGRTHFSSREQYLTSSSALFSSPFFCEFAFLVASKCPIPFWLESGVHT